MKTLVFCDFDGTISKRDVGNSLFKHFSDGENEQLLHDWRTGRISSRECLTREAAMVKAPSDEILTFLNQFKIDPGFKAFEELCRKNGLPITIISDGLDFYINRILARNELSHLPLICNVGRLNGHGIEVEFPRTNRECYRCGTCKGEIIEEYCSQGSQECRTVFVGDGLSDICAIKAASLLFAKKDLERHCLTHNIAYNRYDNFFDVARTLVDLGFAKA